MNQQSFSLIPFPAPEIPEITITGSVSRQSNLLSLQYSLRGQTNKIFFPLRVVHPGRKDDLWKTTCFELFLAVKDASPYWEFNLSPSGDWNIYRMSAYRRIGLAEETRLDTLKFEIEQEADGFAIDLLVDLSPIIRPEQDLQGAITAVIDTENGNQSYWALAHRAPQPDFHFRESFILELGGRAQPA